MAPADAPLGAPVAQPEPASGFTPAKFIRWMTKGGLAILDNGLISGSNFLLGILLARWLAPEEYGAYALAFSLFILVGFLYQALLLEPLSVFAGSSYRDNLRGYLKKALTIHWAISIPTGLVIGAGALGARFFGHSVVLPISLAGMAIATPFLCIHAMARRSFYLRLSPGPAAFGAAFYCAMVTGGIFLVYRQGWLSSFTAFLIMALAALVSAMVMLWQLTSALEPASSEPRLGEIWRKHWEYGSWALATCVVGWIPNYVYIPLVSTFSGMAAAGELRALMNLAAPVLQTYAALSMLFLPYAAGSAFRLRCDCILGRSDSVSSAAVPVSLRRQVHGVFLPDSVIWPRNHRVERQPGTGNRFARHEISAVSVCRQRRRQRRSSAGRNSGHQIFRPAGRDLEHDPGQRSLRRGRLRSVQPQSRRTQPAAAGGCRSRIVSNPGRPESFQHRDKPEREYHNRT